MPRILWHRREKIGAWYDDRKPDHSFFKGNACFFPLRDHLKYAGFSHSCKRCGQSGGGAASKTYMWCFFSSKEPGRSLEDFEVDMALNDSTLAVLHVLQLRHDPELGGWGLFGKPNLPEINGGERWDWTPEMDTDDAGAGDADAVNPHEDRPVAPPVPVAVSVRCRPPALFQRPHPPRRPPPSVRSGTRLSPSVGWTTGLHKVVQPPWGQDGRRYRGYAATHWPLCSPMQAHP